MDLKVYALLNAKIKELTGESVDLSKYYTKEEADAAITAKVAEIVADAPEDFDTLKEMSDWISQHEDSAVAMNSAIQQNATDISDLESGKVDKVDGKSLISDSEITRLASVDNYDDTTIKQRVTTNETNISTLAKHINGDLLDSDFQEDSTVAMTKTVPSGMSNYAAVKIIGGKTQKVAQILAHGDMDGSGFEAYSANNVDVSINGGELTATIKTAGETYEIGVRSTSSFLILKNHVIIVKGDFNPSVDISMGFDIGYTRNRTNCNANVYTTVYDRFLSSNNYSSLVTSPGSIMQVGATYKVKNIQIFDLTAMFGAGNEPTLETFKTMFPEEYYAYTEGELWNAPVESVVSVGRNLFNNTPIKLINTKKESNYVWTNTIADTRERIFPHMVLYKGSSVTKELTTSVNNNRYSSIFTKTGNADSIRIGHSGGAYDIKISLDISMLSDETDYTVSFTMIGSPNVIGSVKIFNVMIEKSSIVTDYSMPFKTTLLIPDSDRNLPCFGYGIDETVQNIRDYENGTYTQMVAEVDLGDLNWSISSTYPNSFIASIDGIQMGERDKIGNILCDKYTANTFDITIYQETDKTIALGTAHNVAITDKSYTDTTAFKEAMKGVKLVYELETPVITDCSDMLMPIRVGTGGTITFNNEHSLDMPNTVVYKKEVSLS